MSRPDARRALDVLLVAARLGVTSFGGPVAHLGYFRDEYVGRHRWLDDRAYAELVALSQFLPGPASSQVGIGVGLVRAGKLGSLLAWLGFTVPSAVLLCLFAWGVSDLDGDERVWLHGLKIAAVAVVAFAVWSMARTLTPDRERIAIAVAGAAVVLAWTSAFAHVVVIAAGALAGWRLLGDAIPVASGDGGRSPVGRRFALASLALFAALLVALPVAGAAPGPPPRAGAPSRRRRRPATPSTAPTASTAPARWSSAAATSSCPCSRRRSSAPAGSPPTSSSPVTAPPRRSRAPCSRSPPTWDS